MGWFDIREWILPSGRLNGNNQKNVCTEPTEFGPGPRTCVICIDASLTMDIEDYPPSRLRAAIDAALAYIHKMLEEQPESRVAIVSYSTIGKVRCLLTPVKNSKVFQDACRRIKSGCFTNITAGLKKAQDLLGRHSRNSQVILLTDGHHNTGGSPVTVSSQLKERAIIECIGIGGSPADVDEHLLRSIASSYPDGSKRYRWIGDKEQLVEHFKSLAGGISRQ